jgi:hypothetical protein
MDMIGYGIVVVISMNGIILKKCKILQLFLIFIDMPYNVRHFKGQERPYCVYNKNTGKKKGCTTKNKLRAYLAALNIHAREKDEQVEQLKGYIKSAIKEMMNEDITSLAVDNRPIVGKIENVLRVNRGFPFDEKEISALVSKQNKIGAVDWNTDRTEATIVSDNIKNVIKKLSENPKDPDNKNFIYAIFYALIPTKIEDPSVAKTPEKQSKDTENPENLVYTKLSQPFDDANQAVKGRIFSSFIDKLELNKD